MTEFRTFIDYLSIGIFSSTNRMAFSLEEDPLSVLLGTRVLVRSLIYSLHFWFLPGSLFILVTHLIVTLHLVPFTHLVLAL